MGKPLGGGRIKTGDNQDACFPTGLEKRQYIRRRPTPSASVLAGGLRAALKYDSPSLSQVREVRLSVGCLQSRCDAGKNPRLSEGASVARRFPFSLLRRKKPAEVRFFSDTSSKAFFEMPSETTVM
jgi:hypothetical protein